MRIFFISAGAQQVSGVLRYDRETVQGLRARGIDVRVFTPDMIHNRRSTQPQSEFCSFVRHTWQGITLYTPARRRAFRALLADYKPDIVHMSLDTALIFSPLASLCTSMGIPVVGTQHQPIQRSPTLLGQYLLASYRLIALFVRKMTRLIVFSQDQMDCMRQARYPAERLVIIPNAVDADKFSPGASAFRASLDADCVILHLGRFSYQKNTNLLLDVFDRCDFGPRVKLVMVGTGDDFAPAQRRYGRHPNIRLLGVIRDEARVIDILRGSDIFAQPSRYEGHSIALLEAMSTGLACITTAVGAHRDVAGGALFLLDPHHVRPQLRLALQNLVYNPELRALLGRQARQRVLDQYALDIMLDRLTSLYNAVLSEV